MNLMNQMNLIPGLAVPKKFSRPGKPVFGDLGAKERDSGGLDGLIFGSSIYIRFILAGFGKKPFKNHALNVPDVLECTRVYIAGFSISGHFWGVRFTLDVLRKYIEVHHGKAAA